MCEGVFSEQGLQVWAEKSRPFAINGWGTQEEGVRKAGQKDRNAMQRKPWALSFAQVTYDLAMADRASPSWEDPLAGNGEGSEQPVPVLGWYFPQKPEVGAVKERSCLTGKRMGGSVPARRSLQRVHLLSDGRCRKMCKV